jgi:putative membrane protein
MRIQLSLIAMTLLLTGLSFIETDRFDQQIIQHIPVIPLLGILSWCAVRRTFSHFAFCGMIMFLWQHILGARWTYSNVPYDDWANAVFGVTVSEQFGWTRNHYDRLVHLMFGILWAIPFVELARPSVPSKFWQALFSLCAIGAFSAVYEIAEWLLTIFMSPVYAERYNGQQGDMWDPQKDMLLAIVGAFVTLVLMNTRLTRERRAAAD